MPLQETSSTIFQSKSEVTPVVREKFELYNQDLSKIVAFLKFLETQDFDAVIKSNVLLISTSSTCAALLLDTMMEEIKIEITEKYAF